MRVRDALALAVVTGSLAILVEAPARACTQPEGVPAPGTISDISPLIDSKTQKPVPISKDGGIVFEVRSGAMSDDDLRAKAKISVTAGSSPVSGELRRFDERNEASGRSTWTWRPQAELPVGTLTLTIAADTFASEEGGKRSFEVAVEDRTITVPKLPISVNLSRAHQADMSAPQITCGATIGSTCGGKASAPVVSTRYRAVPVLAYTTTDTSLDPNMRLFRATVRLYTRDANGAKHQESERPSHVGPGGSVTLNAADAMYCASITNKSLMDGSREETTESCVPHALDLSMTDADHDRLARSALEGCENPVFPEGSSKSDPAGVDGCATTGRPRGNGLGFAAVVIAGALALARRRKPHAT